MVERSLCMREARGSIPRISKSFFLHTVVFSFAMGSVLQHQTMLIPRLSRVGFWIAKELCRGGILVSLEQDLDKGPVDNTSVLRLNYCPKLELFRGAYFKSIMIFLTQLPTMLLKEGTNIKKLLVFLHW
ncbi:uncharacterized protein LOC120157222 [Hibiscus syriacus]|uniref:uncharacterized protein LOC120157222 n=1 Tax=Hibiscus syriacus TaxID=106335 RepID=UPI001920F914|nr:uncharacterized protein LOC120157222 [Hibiscus syriacus]